MITMTALALSIGMIVDGAIVVAENVHRHGKLSANAVEASISGAVQIAGPDASGVLTTVAAFLPMVIVTGIAALFLKPFGVTISAALLVSLALSLTMVPLLFSRGPALTHREHTFLGARLLALFVTGQGLDISVGMGAVTLVGIAVNNAIVLIDYANRRRREGTATADALREAASVRLRPILLTTLTTISALLPTAIGTTVGSRIFQPFAITVIGGLLTGTLATLVLVPTIAVLLHGHDTLSAATDVVSSEF